MELDDLKAEWQSLHARLARQEAISLRALQDARLDRMLRELRPLRWMQAFQILLGALFTVAGGAFWSAHLHTPHLLAMGLVMHVYGLVVILSCARMQMLASRVDIAAPVLEIQRRLAELRRFYVRSALWLGLPWFVLWIPCVLMLLAARYGADVYARQPGVVLIVTAVCAALWALTLFLIQWAQRRPRMARALDAAAAGGSLNRAQARLDEIARFEAE